MGRLRRRGRALPIASRSDRIADAGRGSPLPFGRCRSTGPLVELTADSRTSARDFKTRVSQPLRS